MFIAIYGILHHTYTQMITVYSTSCVATSPTIQLASQLASYINCWSCDMPYVAKVVMLVKIQLTTARTLHSYPGTLIKPVDNRA